MPSGIEATSFDPTYSHMQAAAPPMAPSSGPVLASIPGQYPAMLVAHHLSATTGADGSKIAAEVQPLIPAWWERCLPSCYAAPTQLHNSVGGLYSDTLLHPLENSHSQQGYVHQPPPSHGATPMPRGAFDDRLLLKMMSPHDVQSERGARLSRSRAPRRLAPWAKQTEKQLDAEPSKRQQRKPSKRPRVTSRFGKL